MSQQCTEAYNAISDGGDTITDFSSSGAGNDDGFWFASAGFGGFGKGGIDAALFQSSAADTAGTSVVRFFYETDTQLLRYDADGSGTGSAPVVIAKLQAGATVNSSDIFIV